MYNKPKQDQYEYKIVWGKDRRTQGPLELRKNRATGGIEWRYDGSDWSLDTIPSEIAQLFK